MEEYMNSGQELARLLRRAGATLVKEVGHHQAWRLPNGKTIRIATAGRRPSHIVWALMREIRSAARQQGKAK
jgi:hypothetical protein